MWLGLFECPTLSTNFWASQVGHQWGWTLADILGGAAKAVLRGLHLSPEGHLKTSGMTRNLDCTRTTMARGEGCSCSQAHRHTQGNKSTSVHTQASGHGFLGTHHEPPSSCADVRHTLSQTRHRIKAPLESRFLGLNVGCTQQQPHPQSSGQRLLTYHSGTCSY